ncbi:MAG: hypothetical protein IID33_03120 [Planctomycetes bacterium]|nr:hypothetical protein [Planctomycetota bacterium]
MQETPQAAAIAPHAGRDGLLSPFGLAVVATILAALAGTSMFSLHLLQKHIERRSSQSVPALMRFLTNMARQEIDLPRERLTRLVTEMARMPSVGAVRLTVAATETTPEQTIFPAGQSETQGRYLRSQIRGGSGDANSGQGPLRGELEVWYVETSTAAVLTALWTAAGAGGALSLVTFGLIYRRLRKRIGPISFVRDNLLAYHSGAEKSLRLLTLQDTAGPTGEAWNSLISFVEGLQRELDSFRCRQSVENSVKSIQSLLSQSILDALPIGLVRIDGDDQLAYFNYSAAQMLDINLDEGRDRLVSSRLADPALVQSLLSLRDDGSTGPGRQGSLGLGHVDHEIGSGQDGPDSAGRRRTVVRLSPIPVRDGADDELVVMVQDVSQLVEAARSRDAFLAHITHELRTPLTNIRAYAETLNEDFFDDEQTRRECYNVIMSETQRLSRLIEDVLSVSQIEAGTSRFERVSVRVDQSLRQAVQDVQASADGKSIELSLNIPSKVPLVQGDRLRLQQVWVNLLGNAIKYTPEQGSVSVSVQSDEQVLRVCVTDTGIGIAPEHHEKIFEKFYRVDHPDVSVTEGSGLGLSITQEIIRMHGGSIRIESEEGAGATFVVELPRAGDSADSGRKEESHGANHHS